MNKNVTVNRMVTSYICMSYISKEKHFLKYIMDGRAYSLLTRCIFFDWTQGKLESTGYSTLPSPLRLMWRTHTAWQRDNVTPSVTIPSPLASNLTQIRCENIKKCFLLEYCLHIHTFIARVCYRTQEPLCCLCSSKITFVYAAQINVTFHSEKSSDVARNQ